MATFPGQLLSVPTAIRQDELEDLSASLEATSAECLELPPSLKHNGILGLESRLLQLVVQWARATDEPTLVVPDLAAHQGYLERLCATAYGFAALALARKVIDRSLHPIPMRDIKVLVNKRLADFDSTTLKMFGVDEGYSFISVYGHPREYGNWLFASPDTTLPPRFRQITEMTTWFDRVLAQLIPKEFADRFDSERRAYLSAAAYELLENAHLHGRLNQYAEPIRIGVTGLSVRLATMPFGATAEISGGSQDVLLYFINRLAKDKSQLGRFFEVTVFDSGIGYHRWINARCNDNPETRPFRGKPEAETVLACLAKHSTSKAADGSGVGLFRVTRLLKALFGFVRIRTGHSCFYARLDQTADRQMRRLGSNQTDLSTPEISLRPWFPDRALPDCGGSAITLCVPLTKWRASE